jgi:hypothetical protein
MAHHDGENLRNHFEAYFLGDVALSNCFDKSVLCYNSSKGSVIQLVRSRFKFAHGSNRVLHLVDDCP